MMKDDLWTTLAMVLTTFALAACSGGGDVEEGTGGTSAANDAGGMGGGGMGGAAGDPGDDPAAEADPAAPGPYRVGVCTSHAVDSDRNREMDIDVWYPVAADAKDGTPNEYELGGSFASLGKFPSPALRDATPDVSRPWPAVLFSHGFGGVRFQSYFLTEQLASHGFVVIAPDHPGNRIQDVSDLGNDAAVAQSAVDRPIDMMFALELVEAGKACVEVELDPDRVGITGHSFGGWTTLETTRREPRMKAAFPLAPGFRSGATPDMVEEISVPLLFFGGTEDHTTPFDANQQAPYDLASAPKHLVRIEGAGHLDFSNLCDVAVAKAFINDGCDPTKIEPKDVQSRVSTISTAFAHLYIAGHQFHDAFLEPKSVTALGKLTYQSER